MSLLIVLELCYFLQSHLISLRTSNPLVRDIALTCVRQVFQLHANVGVAYQSMVWAFDQGVLTEYISCMHYCIGKIEQQG